VKHVSVKRAATNVDTHRVKITNFSDGMRIQRYLKDDALVFRVRARCDFSSNDASLRSTETFSELLAMCAKGSEARSHPVTRANVRASHEYASIKLHPSIK